MGVVGFEYSREIERLKIKGAHELPQDIASIIAGLKKEEQEERNELRNEEREEEDELRNEEEEEEDELRNEEQEEGEDELDERSNDEAEPAVEPAAERLALQTITKKDQWNSLNREDKSGIRELVFDIDTLNRDMTIEQFPDLVEIRVNDSCLQDTRNFMVVKCNALTTIGIGSNCLNGRDKKKHYKKQFRVYDCPSLERITVGDSSCIHFDECSISGNSIREFKYINPSFSGCENNMLFTSRSVLCMLIIRHPLQSYLQLG